MIKAVIFDMFETLLTHYQSPLYFSAQMAEDAGIPVDMFRVYWEPTMADRTVGNLSMEAALEMVLRANGCYSEKLLDKMIEKRRETKRDCFRHLHPEIIPMLEELKRQKIKIGLISNCFSEEAEVIRESRLCPYFDAVYLSYEQGMKKPDARIFLVCIKKLGADAGECLYVGDGGSSELEAASRLGMKALQAVWYLKKIPGIEIKKHGECIQMDSPLEVLNYCV